MRRSSWLLLCFVFTGQSPAAEPREAFETASPSWRLGPRDCKVSIARHERRFVGAHGGRGCEYLELASEPGTHIQFVHEVAEALVISELIPSVWVKSELPGVRLQARVVFPRSKDRDGKPLSDLIDGDSCTQAGSWRQLRIDDAYRKMQRAAVGLRTQPGLRVDEAEAFIDRLVLNVYTEPRPNRIWIDDLELEGFVSASRGSRLPATGDAAEPSRTAAGNGPTAEEPLLSKDGLQGDVLVRDGRPIFVRAVEHRGETLAFLQSLGFNAVLVKARPVPTLLDEARRTGIHLITLPPLGAGGIEIGAEHGLILAWYLGEQLAARDADHVQAQVRQIRQAEPQRARPLLLHVAQDYERFRHDQGMLLFDRRVIATSFDPSDFGPWLAHVAQFGRSGAPFWAAIPTEIPGTTVDQILRLGQQPTALPLPEPDGMRLLAFEAVGRGARGLLFSSSVRLDSRDVVAQLRCAALQSLNRELELIAPWAAAGRSLGERVTENPRLRVCQLSAEGAQVLVVSRVVADQQFVAWGSRTSEPLTFTLPAATSSDLAYLVTPQGLSPVPVQRRAGMQLSVDSSQSLSLILLTQNSLAINYVGRIAAEIRQDFAARQVEVAEKLLDETESLHRQLASRPIGNVAAESELQRARADLRQAVRLLDTADATHALTLVNRCRETCRHIRRGYWESTVLSFPSAISSPLCTSFSTLPQHYATADRLARAAWSVDVLAAGEMEQMEHLLQSGWRLEPSDTPHLAQDARLSLESPRAGRYCLQMRVWEKESDQSGIQGQWPL
ncbi:MAG: hypothetical protein AB7O38_10360, partial [Pirellulaceae bacterium]